MNIARTLFIIVLFLPTSLVSFASDAIEFSIESTPDALTVSTSGAPDASLTLVRCWACEYFPTTPFLREYDGVGDDCQTDGYDVDRAYYSPDAVSAFVEKTDAQGSFSIERFSSFERDKGRDKVYDRFYLVKDAQIDSETGFARGGEIVAGPIFPAAPPSLNDEPRGVAGSIKGLEAFDLDDAKELGCAHAAMTVDLCWFVQKDGVETIDYPCCGKTFQFNKKAVDYYDAWTKKATDYDMEVTFVLVFWGHRRRLAPEGWIAPDYELWLDAPYALSIAAPNTTNLDGIEKLQALYEFIGERYTRPDKMFGRASNFVVGNELNSGYIWNNMGRLPLDETVRQYERQLRVAYTAFHKYWSRANVLASFDNYWTKNSAAEFGMARYVDKGGFGGKDYLLKLAQTTRAEGDYPWNVAYHPYGLDLRTPVYWDQYSTEQAAKNENAPRITPYNCEVLADFLDKPETQCETRSENGKTGVKREIYFTEQGFSSPHDDHYGEYNDDAYDPDALPDVWLERQCAAFALAYFQAEAIGAKAYIFHRQFDVKSERLNIGLWARPKDKEMGMAVKKPIWFQFQKIDEPDAKAENEKYLPILRFYPHETPPQSWDELIVERNR
ncbi:MAG: hypothetical protein IJM54_10560 [Thermoguttaceae bacterium]|nr:hypothetical protein [Thermoguttaceae bacterium]